MVANTSMMELPKYKWALPTCKKRAAANGKQGKCYTLAIFATRRGAKMLVGVAPQTRHFWTKCPEVMAASPALSRLFLIPAGGRDPQQMVDVRLNGQGLPHIPLGRVILGIEGFFSTAKYS